MSAHITPGKLNKTLEREKHKSTLLGKLEEKLRTTKDPKQRQIVARKIAELTGKIARAPTPRKPMSAKKEEAKPARTSRPPSSKVSEPVVESPAESDEVGDEWQLIMEAQQKRYDGEIAEKREAARARQAALRADLDRQVAQREKLAADEAAEEAESVLDNLGVEGRRMEARRQELKASGPRVQVELEARREARAKAAQARLEQEAADLDADAARVAAEQAAERAAREARQAKLRADCGPIQAKSPLAEHRRRVEEGAAELAAIEAEQERATRRLAEQKAAKIAKRAQLTKDLEAVQVTVAKLSDSKARFTEQLASAACPLDSLGESHRGAAEDASRDLAGQIESRRAAAARAGEEKARELAVLEAEYAAFQSSKEARREAERVNKLQYRAELTEQIVEQQRARANHGATMDEVERKMNRGLLEDLRVGGKR